MALAVSLTAALLLAQTPAEAPTPGGWAALSPAQRAALLALESPTPLAERLLHVSERFLGTPYLASPLGEGAGVDPDPTFRVDAVDCLTFVEQSMALSLARDESEVASLLERIRYASTPVYEDRNHLMEAQWLPNNVRKGFVVDVTRRYGGEDTVRVQKVLTSLTWQSRSSQALTLPPERQPKGTFSLNMLPLDRILAHARQIPTGTILLVLREDLPLKATRITHLGFVVQKGRRTWLRHAARNRYGRVVDEDLESFLTRNAKYDKWRVTGVSLFEVHPPTEEGTAPSASLRAP
ncbi:N-acetylmuramoyl-L-alanine amidase-like domain-containing protein [Stigmatella erecta]